MSSDVADQGEATELAGIERLGASVRRLLEEHQALRSRLEGAERRSRDLQVALAEVKSGRADPAELNKKIEAFEKENRELRQRLTLAHDVVRRIQVRLDFVGEERG